jgi:hypothetical protein
VVNFLAHDSFHGPARAGVFAIGDARGVDHEEWLPRRSHKINGCAGTVRILEASTVGRVELALTHPTILLLGRAGQLRKIVGDRVPGRLAGHVDVKPWLNAGIVIQRA